MTADLDLAPDAEARLRAALSGAATLAPVDPAWEAICEQVELGQPPLTARSHADRRRARPLLLVAAAVVVVVGIAGLTARGAGDDVVADGRSERDETYCDVLQRPSRSRIEVAVFLDAAEPPDLDAIERSIAETGLADDVTFVDRDTSYAEARSLFEGNPTMLDLLRPEDVPTSFRLTVADEDASEELAAALGTVPGVMDVEDAWRPGAVIDVLRATTTAAERTAVTATRQRVDDVVADALVATAPDELDDALATVDPWLRTLRPPERAEVEAAQQLVDDAASRCGLTVVEAVTDVPAPHSGSTPTMPR